MEHLHTKMHKQIQYKSIVPKSYYKLK